MIQLQSKLNPLLCIYNFVLRMCQLEIGSNLMTNKCFGMDQCSKDLKLKVHQSGEKESAPIVYARNQLTKIIINSLTI